MGYAIKKLLDWCLSPLGLALLLLGAGLVSSFSRRQRLARGLLVAGLGSIVLFSSGPVADVLSRPLEHKYPVLVPTTPLAGVVAVAVLGGGYERGPGKPDTTWVQGAGLERLVEGLRVLRLAPGSRLVVSGWDAGRKITTAEVMEEAAIALGVEPARIFRLDAPRDTAEELAALHRLVGAGKIVIVTSAIHMPRAMELAAHAGLNAVAAPAAVGGTALSGGVWSWVPSYGALSRSSAAIHEWLGRFWSRLVDSV